MLSQQSARRRPSSLRPPWPTFDHHRAHAQTSPRSSRMDARSFSQLGALNRPLDARPRRASAYQQTSPGDGLSVLSRSALTRETIRQSTPGSRLPTRSRALSADTQQRAVDSRERTRLPTVARIRHRSGRGAVRSRERSRRGLLSMIKTKENQNAQSTNTRHSAFDEADRHG